MKGLELSRAYYQEYGAPMLKERFPALIDFLAVGLVGEGSECMGFDDEVSQDHDFEPGFVVFLPGEEIIDRRTAFALERAYAALPGEYEGIRRCSISPVGGTRHGVLRTDAFFRDKCGAPDGCLSLQQWLQVPEQSLAEATGGEVFCDPYGEVTKIRERLAYFPEDIRRKKLAGALLIMAQSGQYNYTRCLQHGETAAAQLAVIEYVKSIMSAVFLLNRVYQPYYKWSFRKMRTLPRLSLLAELLEYLITSDNDGENAREKQNVIEGIAADVIDELMDQELTRAVCQDLEKHAYSVNDGVRDSTVRNMHILAGI